MNDHETKIAMLDKAAELDAAQRSGQTTKSRAAELLVEFTHDGLTLLGALDVLDNWADMKAGRPGRIPGTDLRRPGKSNLLTITEERTP